VELMVAVVIISLALITMMDIFDLSLKTTFKAEKETKAARYAQLHVEEIKNMINKTGVFSHSQLTELPTGYECVIPEDYPYLENGIWNIKVIIRYDNAAKEVVVVTKLGVRDG